MARSAWHAPQYSITWHDWQYRGELVSVLHGVPALQPWLAQPPSESGVQKLASVSSEYRLLQEAKNATAK